MAPNSSTLPTPHERPDADVVIFDGHCAFCTAQVRRLDRWDGRDRLAFVSLHDALVGQRWPDLSRDRLMEEMVVIDGQGETHGGAAAFRYLTRRLPRLWPVAPLLHLPFSLPLWKWLYRQVARRRYRLGGTLPCDDDACKIHSR